VKRSSFCRAWARPAAVVTLLLWAGLSIAPSAGADGAHFHPDLLEALGHVDRAKGPEAYTAIRGVWRTWDRADPLHVEEALRAIAEDSRIAPPARVYAALHVAFARTRRGDFETARAEIHRLGYVDQWLLVGPFDNEGKHGLETEHGPEAELGQAIAVGRAYTGKERAVRWRAVPAAFPYGWLDAGALVRPERKVCVFAKTFVRARKGSRAPRAITAWIGAEGAFELFWNAKRVLGDSAYRGHDFDRSATTLTLEPGTNDLTLKLCGDDAPPVVSLRLGDARGAPDAQIEVTADIVASEEAAALATKLAEQKSAAAARAGPEGPIQAFERAAKSARASDLFAYARYLVATAGDDPTEHRARNLAQRAAEREPTVERLLLAGALSEDRNRRREWVAKAETLANKAGKPNVDLLLARAELARGSPNWRDAVPFYDRVLAIDPNQVDAIRGRVELYNEAGLRRTRGRSSAIRSRSTSSTCTPRS
jgi:cellulose synthase operon protein C